MNERTSFDIQGWFEKAGSGLVSHIHMGGSYSLLKIVSGVQQLDLNFKFHHEHGKFYQFRDQRRVVYPNANEPALFPASGYDLDGAHLREDIWFRRPYDTTRMADGPQMWELEARFNPADPAVPNRSVRLRAGWNVENVAPSGPTGMPDELTAMHWFQGQQYTNVRLDRHTIPVDGTVLRAPHTIKFRMFSSTGDNRDGQVIINPNLHAHPPDPGQIIWEMDAIPPSAWQSVVLDPAQLGPGRHKVMLKGSDEGRHPIGTMQTVFMIFVQV